MGEQEVIDALCQIAADGLLLRRPYSGLSPSDALFHPGYVLRKASKAEDDCRLCETYDALWLRYKKIVCENVVKGEHRFDEDLWNEIHSHYEVLNALLPEPTSGGTWPDLDIAGIVTGLVSERFLGVFDSAVFKSKHVGILRRKLHGRTLVIEVNFGRYGASGDVTMSLPHFRWTRQEAGLMDDDIAAVERGQNPLVRCPSPTLSARRRARRRASCRISSTLMVSLPAR